MNIQFSTNPHIFTYHLAYQHLRNRDVAALCFPFHRTWHFPLGTFCSFNCDGYQYETKPQAQGGRGYAELLFFPTAEGYVKALYHPDVSHHEPKKYQYIYIYKDHLGNNRLSYTLVSGQVYYAVKVEVIFVENKAQNFQHSRVMVKIFNAVIGKKNDAWYGNNTFDLTLNPQTEQVKILEENHYYPFGLKHSAYNLAKLEVKYKEELAEKKEVKQVMADEVGFKYKYNGKELQDELGLNWYDYQARNYDPAIGRWFNPDPLAEMSRRYSPYTYAMDNPVFFVDPDGMLATPPGDFVNENGKIIGNDGKDDGKVYVIKTTKKEFDSGVAFDGISRKQRRKTVKFIRDNSGNTSAFEENSIAYDNSVEIVGKEESRQKMVDIVEQDNGKGGTGDANNREFSGRISYDEKVIETPPSDVTNPKNATSVNHTITIDNNTKSTFHSHPSGSIVEKWDNKTTTYSYAQAPSSGKDSDVNSNNTKGSINYVFGRGNGKVYIYNSKTGVQATLPHKRFVHFKK